MSTTTAQPATTPIPVQLSESEFTAFILPHLSMPKRGPKCKLGYHRVFNLILWVLYTGMQWKCLPIPTEPAGKPAMGVLVKRGQLMQPSFGVLRTFGASHVPGALPVAEVPRYPQAPSLALGMCQSLLQG